MSEEPTQQPANDDQALASLLNGNHEQSEQTITNETSFSSGLQFEDTPAAASQTLATDAATEEAQVVSEPADESQSPVEEPEPPVETAAPVISSPVASANPTDGELEGIKKDALGELRPLVEKLTLPADEKFDIMLLIIRSTDDHSLVASAHQTAKAIEDETKRAQALLDIVKEIDYFSSQHTA